MSVISASDLEKKQFKGFTIPGFEKLIGKAQSNSSIFVWGEKFSGKSTIAVDIAKGLTEELGVVLYCSSEEGISATMQDKIERMEAGLKNLLIGDFSGLEQLKKDVKDYKAKALILDSSHMARLKEADMIHLHDWCKKNDVFFLVVNHATKEGNYKGSTMLAHMVDAEFKVIKGKIITEKNRLPHEIEEMVINYDHRKGGKSSKPKQRENPVKVPFKITLAEIDKIHSIRGIKRLNDLVDFKYSCTIDRNPISFRYRRENKKSFVEALYNGKVEHTHCRDTFQLAWKAMVKEIGTKTVEIENQAHAKLVLGAKEYRKQEKEFAGITKPEKKAKEPKPRAAKKAVVSKPLTDKRIKQTASEGAILRTDEKAGLTMKLEKSTYNIYAENGNLKASFDKISDANKSFLAMVNKIDKEKVVTSKPTPYKPTKAIVIEPGKKPAKVTKLEPTEPTKDNIAQFQSGLTEFTDLLKQALK